MAKPTIDGYEIPRSSHREQNLPKLDSCVHHAPDGCHAVEGCVAVRSRRNVGGLEHARDVVRRDPADARGVVVRRARIHVQDVPAATVVVASVAVIIDHGGDDRIRGSRWVLPSRRRTTH